MYICMGICVSWCIRGGQRAPWASILAFHLVWDEDSLLLAPVHTRLAGWRASGDVLVCFSSHYRSTRLYPALRGFWEMKLRFAHYHSTVSTEPSLPGPLFASQKCCWFPTEPSGNLNIQKSFGLAASNIILDKNNLQSWFFFPSAFGRAHNHCIRPPHMHEA
jgi:hypothetical protein